MAATFAKQHMFGLKRLSFVFQRFKNGIPTPLPVEIITFS